jgi:hypothetical protein
MIAVSTLAYLAILFYCLPEPAVMKSNQMMGFSGLLTKRHLYLTTVLIGNDQGHWSGINRYVSVTVNNQDFAGTSDPQLPCRFALAEWASAYENPVCRALLQDSRL